MGCSTGKFAEPQIQSFSELFIVGPEASAIDYIGNSSLGFESIATSLPPIFYSAMLKDSITRIGVTHLTAKLRQISQQGLSQVNQIMLFNNTLIGDPTVDLQIPFLPNLFIQENLISSSSSVLTDDQDSAAVSIVYANYGSVTGDSVDVQIQHLYHSQVVQSWLLRRPMPLIYDTLTVYISIKQEADEHDVVVTLDPSNKITELTKSDNSATKAFFVSSTDFKIVQPQPLSAAAVSNLVLLNPTTQPYNPANLVTLEVDTLSDYSSTVKPLTLNVPMGVVSTSFSLTSLRSLKRYYWRAKFQTSSGDWSTGTFYQGTDPAKTIGQIDSVGWQGNSFVHTTFLSGTGSKIQNTTIVIQAISGGVLDGYFGAVEINGANKLPNTFERGYSIVVIDPNADTVIRVGQYDLYGNSAFADTIVQFLNSIANGEIVVSVIIGEGSYNLTSAVKNGYHTIGSKFIDSIGYRDSWAIIGRKGAVPGSVQEEWKKSTTGKAILDTTIAQIVQSGSITTSTIGPVSGWNQLLIDRSVPSGAHATVTMLGVMNSGHIDTLFNSYDSSSVNLQKISAVRYPNARLVFNLAANSSLNSPAVSDWSIKAQLPPELVLSQNTTSLEKSIMQEGEIINVGASVYNVGASAADSVLISILTDDSGALRTLKNTIASFINAQDSVHVQTQYDSRGRRGNHSFTFQADPNNAITEFYKSNNTAVVPYTVLADTLSPSIDVTFDNMHVLNGDYVRAAPLVIFQVRDPNGASISQADTSNVYIELDGNEVYYSGSSTIQFAAGTSPLIAQVRWTPQLTEGQHAVRYFAKDAAGNSSDTTLLSVNVTNTLQLSEVYNIPNPFPNGTTFTFILAGTDNPQSVHVKIYTVAGRLIQDLDFSSRVHIGINGYESSSDNLYWNGRDKDGDEIANGVYFYRVVDQRKRAAGGCHAKACEDG